MMHTTVETFRGWRCRLVEFYAWLAASLLLAFTWLSTDCTPRRRQAGFTIMEYTLLAVVVIGVFGFFMFNTFAPTVLKSLNGMLTTITSVFSKGCAAANGSC